MDLSVIVCEDDQDVGMQAVRWIEAFFAQGVYRVRTALTQSVADCLNAYAQTGADLVVTDIMLGEQSGYDLAAAIRRRRDATEIIFITAYSELMREAFAFKPLDFLCKPFSRQNVDDVLRRFVLELAHKQRVYQIVTRECVLNLRCSEIVFFESRAHSILCYCVNRRDPVRFTGKLDTIEEQLQDAGFVRTHKSFLINIALVVSLDRPHSRFLLSGDAEAPISRRHYQTALEAYLDHFFT